MARASKSDISIIDPMVLGNALSEINDLWDKLSRTQQGDVDTLIGMPNTYLVPSSISQDGFMFNEMYYWDNYFINLGLIESKREDLLKGVVDNQLALIQRFGMVPNASRYYMLSRSQPPTLTSQIFQVYEQSNDLDWLKASMEVAEDEYYQVWMKNEHPHFHNVFNNLSRYYDINVLHSLAEAESGWDYTPRFKDRCLDFYTGRPKCSALEIRKRLC